MLLHLSTFKQPSPLQPGPKSHGPALPTHSNPTGWISQNIRASKVGQVAQAGERAQRWVGLVTAYISSVSIHCYQPPGCWGPRKHYPGLEAKQLGWYRRVIYYFLPCQIALECWLTSRQLRLCFKGGRVQVLIQDRLSGPEWTSFLWYLVAS